MNIPSNKHSWASWAIGSWKFLTWNFWSVGFPPKIELLCSRFGLVLWLHRIEQLWHSTRSGMFSKGAGTSHGHQGRHLQSDMSVHKLYELVFVLPRCWPDCRVTLGITAEIVALQTHEFRSWLAVETCFDSAGVMQRCFTGASLVAFLAVADPVFSLIFCVSQIRPRNTVLAGVLLPANHGMERVCNEMTWSYVLKYLPETPTFQAQHLFSTCGFQNLNESFGRWQWRNKLASLQGVLHHPFQSGMSCQQTSPQDFGLAKMDTISKLNLTSPQILPPDQIKGNAWTHLPWNAIFPCSTMTLLVYLWLGMKIMQSSANQRDEERWQMLQNVDYLEAIERMEPVFLVYPCPTCISSLFGFWAEFAGMKHGMHRYAYICLGVFLPHKHIQIHPLFLLIHMYVYIYIIYTDSHTHMYRYRQYIVLFIFRVHGPLNSHWRSTGNVGQRYTKKICQTWCFGSWQFRVDCKHHISKSMRNFWCSRVVIIGFKGSWMFSNWLAFSATTDCQSTHW